MEGYTLIYIYKSTVTERVKAKVWFGILDDDDDEKSKFSSFWHP